MMTFAVHTRKPCASSFAGFALCLQAVTYSQCTLGSLLLPRSRASPYACIHSQIRLQAVVLPLYAGALLITFAYIIPCIGKKCYIL